MSDRKLIGQNYTTPDLVAKVTGRAKYAEDYRADGMLFAKLLLSPMPHARVTRIDARAALALPGVKAILTADDLPAVVAGQSLGEGIVASGLSERGLTMEPLYQGEPVLAVAAVHESSAARDPVGDGGLAERKAVHSLLDPGVLDAGRRRRRAMGRQRARRCGPHQRVHRGRIRQQRLGVGIRRHSVVAVEEDQ